ncbi:hypothetical protein ACCO45_002125 [Purpureocillium lilacinum]|uniref:Uncharacterized protein n=1 Tax=Purpureocillium lilacinum TaxID=33203 RepID=A0ACC4E9I6_PURLI
MWVPAWLNGDSSHWTGRDYRAGAVESEAGTTKVVFNPKPVEERRLVYRTTWCLPCLRAALSGFGTARTASFPPTTFLIRKHNGLLIVLIPDIAINAGAVRASLVSSHADYFVLRNDTDYICPQASGPSSTATESPMAGCGRTALAKQIAPAI